jgi:hypothetical protein
LDAKQKAVRKLRLFQAEVRKLELQNKRSEKVRNEEMGILNYMGVGKLRYFGP